MINETKQPWDRAATRLAVQSGKITLETEATVPYGRDQVWSVVADYDNLHRYMPNLRSKTVSTTSRGRLVEQVARSSLVPLMQFRLILEFIRESPERLSFRRVEGSLSRFDGNWLVLPVPGGSRILYQLTARHGFPLPGFMLQYAIRTDVDQMMPAITAELGRRNRRTVNGPHQPVTSRIGAE